MGYKKGWRHGNIDNVQRNFYNKPHNKIYGMEIAARVLQCWTNNKNILKNENI